MHNPHPHPHPRRDSVGSQWEALRSPGQLPSLRLPTGGCAATAGRSPGRAGSLLFEAVSFLCVADVWRLSGLLDASVAPGTSLTEHVPCVNWTLSAPLGGAVIVILVPGGGNGSLRNLLRSSQLGEGSRDLTPDASGSAA